jgi:hypothetical protein
VFLPISLPWSVVAGTSRAKSLEKLFVAPAFLGLILGRFFLSGCILTVADLCRAAIHVQRFLDGLSSASALRPRVRVQRACAETHAAWRSRCAQRGQRSRSRSGCAPRMRLSTASMTPGTFATLLPLTRAENQRRRYNAVVIRRPGANTGAKFTQQTPRARKPRELFNTSAPFSADGVELSVSWSRQSGVMNGRRIGSHVEAWRRRTGGKDERRPDARGIIQHKYPVFGRWC